MLQGSIFKCKARSSQSHLFIFLLLSFNLETDIVDLERVWSPMKKLCLCHHDLFLSCNIFARQCIFVFGCFLKRKLFSILFAAFLALLLQTSRKWGTDLGYLHESLKLPSLMQLLQSESLFHVATSREAVEGH